MVYTDHMTITDTTVDTDPDTSKLSKIRALLDKAESTASTFPEEAEALTAKAIELMERYRINEAMIADARPLVDRGKIVEVTVNVGSGPYVNSRVGLANAVAANHSVTLLQSTGYDGKRVHLCGYEADVALTEMLYTSLLVQATSALSSPEVKASKPGHVHGTAFSRAFLSGYALRIDQRLREASAGAAADVDTSERSVALVLADRTKAVNEDVFRRYGKLRSAPAPAATSSYEGVHAGINAANNADLGTDRRVATSTRRALSA